MNYTNTLKVQYLHPLEQGKKYNKEIIIDNILQKMLALLDNQQLDVLKKVLNYEFNSYEFIEKKVECGNSEENEDLFQKFISAKKLEGRTIKTLDYYSMVIKAMITKLNKNIQKITTEDLRQYLSDYQAINNSSKVTMDNMRRILNSFFAWLEDEDYIVKNPVRRIHKVKIPKLVKETYTDEQLELMRNNCKNKRDLAIINLLISTGMRVGEVIGLNKDDINFTERECVVFGKGEKERIVYFDARTKLSLEDYIKSRIDDNSALFVSLKKPYERLNISGIEILLRKSFSDLLGIRVYPHKFRRTLATMAIDKGMPIEQLQKLLGHEKIDTTLHYAMVKQSNIKNAHKKYIG